MKRSINNEKRIDSEQYHICNESDDKLAKGVMAPQLFSEQPRQGALVL
jgi:hypothetical protein